MIKTRFSILTALLVLCSMWAWSQVVYTEPAVVQQSSTGIVVYFNAAEGNKGLAGYTGDVYAHTGVVTNESTNDSDWKHAPSKWGDNSAKYKLENAGTDLWKLNIGDLKTYYGLNAGETVKRMAFVFRSGDCSREGKTASGGDIFIDVYADGLAINLTSDASSNVLTDANCTVKFSVSTTQAANISLHLDDANSTAIASQSNTTSLTHTYTFPKGSYDVIAKAVAGGETKLDTISLCHRGNSQQVAYSGTLKEGANANADGSVTFCLYAPNKGNVMLVGEWDDYRMLAENVMNYQGAANDRYFWLTVPAGTIDMDKQYGYYFIVDDNIYVADPYAKLILDPWNDKYINQDYERYPDLKPFPTGKVNEFAIAVFHGNGDGYQWEVTDFEAPAKEDLVIYEMLLRDFTDEQCLESAMTHLDYLQALGINAIELMPIMEFDGNNSWGYNPNFYFAPDKYYGTSTMYKTFIDECHKRGIAVILDIVFNHTWGQHPWCKMYWDATNNRPTADSPFYNDVAPHNWSVGNDWKIESEHVRGYLCDVLQYWLEEYHVDGYRFDLAKGLGDSDSYANDYDASAHNASRIANMQGFMDAMWEVNPDAYAIFEYFVATSEENAIANYGGMSWKNLNSAYRQAAMGWQENSSFRGMWTGDENRPFGSTVGYMESHDEERMGASQLMYGNGMLSSTLAFRMRRLGSNAAFALLVPGAKMIWQFGELGYDISGGNGDTDPKEPHWEYYDNAQRKGLYDTYVKLLQIRRYNPDLFSSDAEFYWNVGVNDWETGRFITMRNANHTKELVVAYNTSTTGTKTFNYTFDNPDGNYYIVAQTHGVSTISFDAKAGTITLPQHCFVVIGNEDAYNGVDDVEIGGDYNNITIFPNPAADYIYVNSNDVESIEVYSLSGQLVATSNGANSMDVSSLAAGNYIVRIFTPQGVQAQKLMKR